MPQVVETFRLVFENVMNHLVTELIDLFVFPISVLVDFWNTLFTRPLIS